jgi:hypothetical protein
MNTLESREYLTEAFDEIEVTAKNLSCSVVYSTPTSLLLDLDTGAQRDQFERMLPKLNRTFPAKERERWASKSKKGLHVVVDLETPLAVPERIALQCSLGSDPMREMLGIALHQSGIENPIVLFRPAPETGAVSADDTPPEATQKDKEGQR